MTTVSTENKVAYQTVTQGFLLHLLLISFTMIDMAVSPKFIFV